MIDAACSRQRAFPAPVFPFSAIVGQEGMKLALLLNAVDPRIGGVLIRGEKGTAKSTAVRALASLMPECPFFSGCSFACDPAHPEEWCPDCRKRTGRLEVRNRRARVVTLPLNATEDMVLGGIDFSETIFSGRYVIQPGLLAKAHRGILYIDEVNLLDDHLVDLVLDAAASGENIVEREGISFRHPTRFTLIGTMNPEEGALRPQLLDRFGLCVEVTSECDLSTRVELMERRDLFELHPDEFLFRSAREEARLSDKLAQARETLPSVSMEPRVRSYVSELTLSHHVAGHRADLAMERAACAHAAWNGRRRADEGDVLTVAEMALMHRRREPAPPPQHSPPPSPKNDETDRGERGTSQATPPEPSSCSEQAQTPMPGMSEGGGKKESPAGSESSEQIFPVGTTFPVKRLVPPIDRLIRRGSGRRSRTRTSLKQGRYVRSRISSECRDLALDATLRAAAPYQLQRRESSRTAVVIHRKDWREKVREKRTGTFILFIVDGSGSMGSRGRMAASKGAIMSLLLDAYQKRDRIAMVSFRRREATVLLPPTASIEVAARLLGEMPVGGRTPLSAGLVKGFELLQVQLRREPNLRPLAVLITDGKSNVPIGENPPMEEALGVAEHIGRDMRIHWIVVDTEEPGMVRFELARHIARALDGEYFRIDDLRAADLVRVLKGRIA